MNAQSIPNKPQDCDAITIAHSPAGRGFRLNSRQFLPYSPESVFDFFSDAANLEQLTPSWLRFSIRTPLPIAMNEGTLIDYRLRVHGVPLRWRSHICDWEPPFRFVDEQIRGPYRSWRHEHVFEVVNGGVLCRDVVDYEVPGGSLIHRLFVRPDLLKIFAYRQRRLCELFPPRAAPTAISNAPKHASRR